MRHGRDMMQDIPITIFLRALLVVTLLTPLSGCFESVSTEDNPVTSSSEVASYLGPTPANAEVRAFMTNLWENLRANNRCGACHSAGGQTPNFARDDDVNLAYSAALGVVDLSSPADSLMVGKVAGGHNCWLDSDAACGAVITAYIEAWAGGQAAATSRQIELTAPPLKDAGASKSFPTDASLFAATVHPLLTTHCAGCHTDTAPLPQAPFFAGDDADTAYEAVKTSRKLDLDIPANSRLVVRLRQEFHNCWSDDCQNDAQALENAVSTFANGVQLTQLDSSLVTSKALSLYDGIIASGGSRHDDHVIALYEFKTGAGDTVYDTSGVEPGLHLQLSGTEGVDYDWVGGWGMEFTTPQAKAQGTTTASKKLHDRIKASGEYAIEAWAVPANVTQEGPARIISYSAGVEARNVTLGQTQYQYAFLHRSRSTDGNGMPALISADDDEDLQATQQHVVITFDPVQGRRIYLNGVDTDDADPQPPGSLADWNDSYALVFGNEVSGNRPWQGKLRLVAVHDRALSAEQIQQNFAAGVGEKFYLLFGLSHLIDVPQSYLMLEVSQFDNYSYLFNQPTFISLDPTAQPASIAVQGLRIGLNGKEVKVGQAYRNLDTSVGGASYSDAGQVISSLGAVIALEKGPKSDEFFLTFERLGQHSNVVLEAVPLQPAAPPDSDPQPDIGLRTFDEVNATMAAVTGISTTEPDVQATFDTIKQQLPVSEKIEGFLSAHQVAISQLAIEYCNALVENNTLRVDYFPGFDFNAAAANAFAGAGRDLVIDPLIGNMLGSGLTTQPDDATVKGELNNLITRLSACGAGCAADRTKTVVKATCATVLGSAALLVH